LITSGSGFISELSCADGQALGFLAGEPGCVEAGKWSTGTNGIEYTTNNVGIGTAALVYRLQVGNVSDGSQARANAWNTLSDERLKKDFRPITARKMGVKAQEVEKVFPELISEGSDGFKSVSYDHLVAPLIEGVKELNQKVEALSVRQPASFEKNEVEKLKEENKMLKTYLCLKDPVARFCQRL
jgi:hypothetical protein